MTEIEKQKNNEIEKSRTSFDEAVLSYANGDSKKATQHVLATILTILEKAKNTNTSHSNEILQNKKNWILVLDMFQALKLKEKFNVFSFHYANFFHITPPTYNENYNLNDLPEQVGRTNLNINIDISEINESKIFDFEESSIQNKTCLINFSRSVINPNNKNTLMKLYILNKTMVKIRESGANGVILGETDFLTSLKKIIKQIEVDYSGKEDEIPKVNKFYWLFTCELYQWLGFKQEFEDLSAQYSKIFKITPPAFFDDGVMKKQGVENKDADMYIEDKTRIIKIEKDILTNNVEKLLKLIKVEINNISKDDDNERKIIIIDFKNISRIDFNSASTIAMFLSKEFESNNYLNKHKIIIRSPFEFIIRLFDITGVSNYVTYQERNRNIGG